MLGDYRSKLGEEYILSAFPFETDKYRAMQILQTVSACDESKTTFLKKILQLCVFTLTVIKKDNSPVMNFLTSIFRSILLLGTMWQQGATKGTQH